MTKKKKIFNRHQISRMVDNLDSVSATEDFLAFCHSTLSSMYPGKEEFTPALLLRQRKRQLHSFLPIISILVWSAEVPHKGLATRIDTYLYILSRSRCACWPRGLDGNWLQYFIDCWWHVRAFRQAAQASPNSSMKYYILKILNVRLLNYF